MQCSTHTVPYFRNFMFVRVCSLFGGYFYNMYIVKSWKLCLCHYVNIILNLPITNKSDSVLCQSECACLHQTVNIVVFFLKIMKTPTQKGEHSCKCIVLSLKRKEGIGKHVHFMGPCSLIHNSIRHTSRPKVHLIKLPTKISKTYFIKVIKVLNVNSCKIK